MLPLVLLELSNLSPQERATYLSAASSLPSLPPAGKQLPGLASTSPSSCRGQMIMVDDRSLVDTNERVVKAVAINWLVAQRYGWSFTLVRPHQRPAVQRDVVQADSSRLHDKADAHHGATGLYVASLHRR